MKILIFFNSTDCKKSYQDIMYELYIKNEILEGLEDIKNGNIYTVDEIKEIIADL